MPMLRLGEIRKCKKKKSDAFIVLHMNTTLHVTVVMQVSPKYDIMLWFCTRNHTCRLNPEVVLWYDCLICANISCHLALIMVSIIMLYVWCSSGKYSTTGSAMGLPPPPPPCTHLWSEQVNWNWNIIFKRPLTVQPWLFPWPEIEIKTP